MPSKSRPGWVGIYVELPEALAQQLREYCERTGGKLSDEIRQAITRHLAYPPAPTTPAPFPASTAPAEEPAPPTPASKPKRKPKGGSQ